MEEIKKALKVAEECMPSYEMIKCYDYGDMYYFSCKRKGSTEFSNGPFISKDTLKKLSISSSEAMMLGDFLKEIDLKKEGLNSGIISLRKE